MSFRALGTALKKRFSRCKRDRERIGGYRVGRRDPDLSRLQAFPPFTFHFSPITFSPSPWLTQGKTNSEIASILGNSESTVKKHVLEIFRQARGRNPNHSQPARPGSAQFAGSSRTGRFNAFKQGLHSIDVNVANVKSLDVTLKSFSLSLQAICVNLGPSAVHLRIRVNSRFPFAALSSVICYLSCASRPGQL